MTHPNTIANLARFHAAARPIRHQRLADFAIMAENEFRRLGLTRTQYERAGVSGRGSAPRSLSNARASVAALLRSEGASYPMIAKCVGLRNHTSVWYALRKLAGEPRHPPRCVTNNATPCRDIPEVDDEAGC